MEDLWEKLNEKIPVYFHEIAESYYMQFIKISRISTALVNNKFALLISIDRFSADVNYIIRDRNRNLVNYSCGNFFAEKYNSLDRQNLVVGNTAKEMVINNLIVISRGLRNKWSDVLKGSTEWIGEFEKSKWYSIRKVDNQELKVLESFIK